MRSEQYEQIDSTAWTLATRGSALLRRDQMTFPGSSPSPDLVRGLARDSCFFGTNQPLRWVRGEPAMTEGELCKLCELLACSGSTPGVSWPNRPQFEASSRPSLPCERGEREGFCAKRSRTRREPAFGVLAWFLCPKIVPLPTLPGKPRRVGRGLETSSRQSRGESLTLEELL